MRWWLALAPAALGCASTSPAKPFHDVSALVEERTGFAPRWNVGSPEDAAVDRAVHDLLAKDLTVDAAVEVALLRNRRLTAAYEELSVSQAELVQAGLLRNPVFSAGMTTAEADRLDPNLELGLDWDFLSLLMLPARTAVAKSELEATKMRVAAMVIDHVADVEAAYFELQAAQQIVAMRRIVADAAQASADVAAAQHDAGNVNDLTLANEQSATQAFVLDLATSRADAIAAREKLTRLMGVWGEEAGYRVADKLPDLPKTEVPLEHLESMAVAKRPDLEALRRQREAVGRALSLVKSTRFTPAVGAGVSAARLIDGNIALAPRGSLELPIFDQKQATVARLEAELRRADDELRARAVEVRSEVRAARDRVQFERGTVTQFRDVIIPLRERLVMLSQQQYNSMLLGVYQLLLAKQSEVSAYRDFIQAARDYWMARVELDRAAGARLGAHASSAAAGAPLHTPEPQAPGAPAPKMAPMPGMPDMPGM